MKSLTILAFFLAPALASRRSLGKRANSVDVIEFENVGYTGYYYDVEKYSKATSDDCSCTLSDSFTVFEGSNAPLNEELSIHFRGPLTLETFGSYVSSDSSSGTWERLSYYSALDQTAENVTFLTHAGEESTCMGTALSYAGTNGTAYSDSATILESDNLINSNQEFIIFTNETCPDSDADNSCGLYREGIPAYHGFDGTTKMFLFEFKMPEATVELSSYYDMPAIWFLNAKIPRLSQYGSESACSCWNSGCGELDIFEVMNSLTTTHLYSTIHDYQGSDDINNGMQASGYFTRDTSSTMKGGVVFGTDGTVSIFMLDSLEISSSLDASTVLGWIQTNSEAVMSLSSVTMNTSTSASKTSGGIVGIELGLMAMFTSMMFSFLMYF